MKRPWFCVLIGWIFVLSVSCYRLPTSVIPNRYKIKILSHLGEPDNFNFDGQVWIEVVAHEPTQNITLHSRDLNITKGEVTVNDVAVRTQFVKVDSVELDPPNDFLIINLAQKLEKDHKYELLIPFKGELADNMKGFYRSTYTDQKTKTKKWLAITQFEATDARKAFPCFDEPAMKAVFEITIGRKNSLSSLSNMPLVDTQPVKEKEGWSWDRFAPTVPMSTYLVAFMVSDFGFEVSKRSASDKVEFRVWTRRDTLDQVSYASEIGPRVLKFYENFFDIEYPLPKEDMVAIPDFASGAMENWGLITFRERNLLFDQRTTPMKSKQYAANVIAHELAHQWFGNLVTMKWWTDLWLNEGFATYMASRTVDHLFPEWKSFEQDSVNCLLNVFSLDSLRSSHPVSVPIGHPNEISEIFDTISYDKGALVVRMMSLFLGEETFRQGVSNYLKAHKYQNAQQDDLWQSLTEVAHKNHALPNNLTVKTVMDTWTLQTGYPIITVTRNYEKKTAAITQERFLRDANKLISNRECWWVPLSYTNGIELKFDSAEPKSWLSCPARETTIEELPDTWILLNIQVGGLYKINYDERNWKLLIATLNSENHTNIPVLNKVQLLYDADDLAWEGSLSYELLFKLFDYLKLEQEYLPWDTAFANLNRIKKQLKGSPASANFEQYMRDLLTPVYSKVGGFDISRHEPTELDAVKFQVMITAKSCTAGVEGCVSDALKLFKLYRENPDQISKEVGPIVVCTGVKYGGEEEWEFVWNQYKKSTAVAERSSLKVALACTKKAELLKRYLELSITPNSGIRKQDSSVVFTSVASHRHGFEVAKDFLLNRSKNIFRYLAKNVWVMKEYFPSIANQVTKEDDYAKLTDFAKANQMVLKEVQQGVNQGLERAKINLQWQRRRLPEVEKLLTKYGAKDVQA